MSDQDKISLLRGALSKIADRTGEKMKTKALLENAVDAIGLLACKALIDTT